MKKRYDPRWINSIAPTVGRRFCNHLRVRAESHPYRSYERNQLIAEAKEFEREQVQEGMRLVEEVLSGRWTKDWVSSLGESPDTLFENLQEWIGEDVSEVESYPVPEFEGARWIDEGGGKWRKEE